MNRCVNLDWLEVYCWEPSLPNGFGKNDASRLAEKGWYVTSRGYGTPLYEEVLFVSTHDAKELTIFEIRRKPRTDGNGNCLVPLPSCHIRLTNMFLYTEFPIVGLCNFLLQMAYEFKQIKRVDIALDFNYFDTGENPLHVLNAYIQGKLSKINQTNVGAHGADRWDGRFWNSVKWGSPSSNINVKLYNKTLEMKQTKPKYYIQDAWKSAGLKTDIPVWRVEFSIKAGSKGFINTKTQEFHKMQLSQISTRSKLLFIFHSLCSKYFHFKYFELNEDGKPKRKDRCRDKVLFNISLNEQIYQPADFKGLPDISRIDKIVMNRCYRISQSELYSDDYKQAAKIVADHIAQRLYPYVM